VKGKSTYILSKIFVSKFPALSRPASRLHQGFWVLWWVVNTARRSTAKWKLHTVLITETKKEASLTGA